MDLRKPQVFHEDLSALGFEQTFLYLSFLADHAIIAPPPHPFDRRQLV